MNSESKVSESQRLVSRIHASHKRRYAKAVGLILVAVAAGALIGFGGATIYFKKSFHRVPPKPDAIVDSLMEHMRNNVKLEPGEEKQLKEIMERGITEVDGIRKASFEDSKAVFNKMNEEVEEVLGPDRYKIWEEFKNKRWGEKWRSGKGKHKGRHTN